MINTGKEIQAGAGRVVGLLYLSLLVACGGGGGSNDGAAPRVPPPPPPVVETTPVDLSAENVIGGSTESGTASATVTYNVSDATIEASVSLAGVVAESVSLRRGYAGETGEEIYGLVQGNDAANWSLAATPIAAGDAADLDSGALYLSVTTTAHSDGALRGQVTPQGVTVLRFDLSPEQVAGGSDSTADGVAWLTLDSNASKITAHVQTTSLADADSAFIGRALAGSVGSVIARLIQDSLEPGHWYLATADMPDGIDAAIAAAELHVSLSTPALPDGAIRGQYVPDDMELVLTDLDSASVVLNTASAGSEVPAGRVMITIGHGSMSANLNLFEIADAAVVELRQGPAGQNGPSVATFEQDFHNPNYWQLDSIALDAGLAAGLDNRALYIHVATPAAPEGAARGQIVTTGSSEPADLSQLVVTMIDPPAAAELSSLPPTVYITLNREPLAGSVSPQSIIVEASGADGSFGDGNETIITPASVAASGNTIEIGLAGVIVADDVYRVSVTGGGGNGIVDTSGIPLDGDGDGEPGGTYSSAFEVRQEVAVATLSSIQEQIFTPTCATAGCHSGSNAPDGLVLTAGNAWSNIVNIASVQMPSLKRVAPGDPDNSYLVRKVQGTGIVASRMPLGGAPLTQQQIDLIREWVLEGAADN